MLFSVQLTTHARLDSEEGPDPRSTMIH